LKSGAKHRWRKAAACLVLIGLAPGTWLRSPEPPPNDEQVLRFTVVKHDAGRLGPFQLAGAWHMTSPNDLFGSYSAMVAPAPGRLLAFSDRGLLLDFAQPGGAQGPVRIGAVPGKTVRHKQHRDVESATFDPSTGRIYLALEGQNAVSRHGPNLALEARRTVPEMGGWGYNAGAEAMVRLSDGRFVLLCECRTGWLVSDPHPALLFAGDPASGGAGERFTFVGPAGYRPTDMAELPDGRVLILARRLSWPMPPRFKAKLLLADPAEIAPGGTWRAVELAQIEAPLPIDNFEALAITMGAGGGLSAWLLSDDNQALSQRSLLLRLDFLLKDLPEKQKAPEISDAPR
jgi:hypothetical protein